MFTSEENYVILKFMYYVSDHWAMVSWSTDAIYICIWY